MGINGSSPWIIAAASARPVAIFLSIAAGVDTATGGGVLGAVAFPPQDARRSETASTERFKGLFPEAQRSDQYQDAIQYQVA